MSDPGHGLPFVKEDRRKQCSGRNKKNPLPVSFFYFRKVMAESASLRNIHSRFARMCIL